jgi:hypothetical protein
MVLGLILRLSKAFYILPIYVSLPDASSISYSEKSCVFTVYPRLCACVHKFARCNSKKKQAWRLDGVSALALLVHVCLVAASSSSSSLLLTDRAAERERGRKADVFRYKSTRAKLCRPPPTRTCSQVFCWQNQHRPVKELCNHWAVSA